MSIFKDFLGRNLEINDSVIFITKGYRDYTLGRIQSFTPKNVRVAYKNQYGDLDSLIQDESQLVKVDGPDLTMYLLKKED